MTPLSFPAAATVLVGTIQMGETSDKVRAEQNEGWVAGRGPPDRFLQALRRDISCCFYIRTLRM